MGEALGTKIGHYKLLQLIGEGGFGSVYMAEQLHPVRRKVALKIIKLGMDTRQVIARFEAERQALAMMDHPNIAKVLDAGATETGRPYFVMELVKGVPITQYCDTNNVSTRERLDLFVAVCRAVQHAHQKGIIHRDIKPSNILVTMADGIPIPKVIDFGIAKATQNPLTDKTLFTEYRALVGTPEYMSPEQAADELVGPASDVYSLAVVAYEMLTGRVPFLGDTPAAVLLSHVTKAMPATRELRGELSAHVEDVLRRGLAKRPEERYPSTAAFVAALKPAAWPSRHLDEPSALPTRRLALPDRRPVVLVVDDGAANRELIEACLAGVECHVRTAEDGPAALKSVQASPPDLVLLDVQMPGMDGYEVCRRIKGISATRLVPVVMITSLDQTNDRVRALEAGADDYMTKPVDRVELVARVRSALRLKGVYDSLDSAEHVIFALAAAVEAKDPYTEAHTQRVADAARAIGSRMNLPMSDLDALYRGGLIHDIGKIGIPDAILLKPGPLDPRELAIMQQHPMIGENIVAPLRSGASLLPIIRHHHERFDGTGYPDRLSGAGIPRLARVVAVCDAFDALVNDRPYRARKTLYEAVATLRTGAGTQWDPEVVSLFASDVPSCARQGAA